jgi:hypothetical protein
MANETRPTPRDVRLETEAAATIGAVHRLIHQSADPTITAIAVMTISIDLLAQVGGREAAAEVLNRHAQRVLAGGAPESPHEPGHA